MKYILLTICLFICGCAALSVIGCSPQQQVETYDAVTGAMQFANESLTVVSRLTEKIPDTNSTGTIAGSYDHIGTLLAENKMLREQIKANVDDYGTVDWAKLLLALFAGGTGVNLYKNNKAEKK